MKRLLIFAGLITGFVLAALAFWAVPNWFESTSVTAQENLAREREIVIAVEEVKVINGEETVVAGEVVVKLENPPELPDGPAAVDGIFKGHEGDTISVGTGNIDVSVEVEQVNDQEPVMAVSASHSGPLLDIVTTVDTVIYLETTAEPKPPQADLEAGEMTVPRSIEAGSLDDLGEDTMIQAWGSRDGDTITADVLVITPIR